MKLNRAAAALGVGALLLATLGCATPHPVAEGGPRPVEIRVSRGLSSDEAALAAATSLHAALREMCGIEATLVTNATGGSSGALLIDCGGPGTSGLGPDGFLISGGGSELVVKSADILGAIYGTYELERLVRLRQYSPFEPISRQIVPAFRYRIGSVFDDPRDIPYLTEFSDPGVVLRLGYNGVIVERALAEVVTLDEYDPDLYPKGSEQRAKALERRNYVRDRIEKARKQHLSVFIQGDMITVPKAACDKYGDDILTNGEISMDKPKTMELMEAIVDEALRLFPEVDGVVVRSGENTASATGYLRGVNPFARGKPDASEEEIAEKQAEFVEALADIIVGRYHKIYIQRTWGYYVTWHTVPERYLAATDLVTARPGLFFSMKHPETDYWRYNRINPTIGIGKHPQMVEFECAREYEGKGAFPLYGGRLFAEGGTEIEPYGGVRYIYDKGVRGVWAWLSGAGLDGPYRKREEWLELDAYALSRLLWNPDADPYEIAREWCQIKFGIEPDSPILDRFESICRKSEEAVLKARYCRALTELGKPYQTPPAKYLYGWAPGGAWFRDASFGAKGMRGIYKYLAREGGQETVEAAIHEKEEAREAYESLMEDFDAIVKLAGPSADWTELHITAEYGNYWVEIATRYFVGIVRYDQWLSSGKTDESAKAAAIENFLEWQEAWSAYNDTMPGLPGAPSMCRSDGMVEMCQEAIADLQEHESAETTAPEADIQAE